MKKMYCIREDYIIRGKNDFLDTSGRSDEYQNDVYVYAKKITESHDVKTISDVGCGSAYKLLKYFKSFEFNGYDLEPTVTLLKERFPENDWIISDFNSTPKQSDLVICADVIEHVDDPDELIGFIMKMNPKHVVLSTPDRDLLYYKLGRSIVGPPANKHHIREWTFDEFREYIGRYFNIIDQVKIEHEYGQLIYCTQKK